MQTSFRQRSQGFQFVEDQIAHLASFHRTPSFNRNTRQLLRPLPKPASPLQSPFTAHALVYRDHAHRGPVLTNAHFEKAKERRATADGRDPARLLSEGTRHEGYGETERQ